MNQAKVNRYVLKKLQQGESFNHITHVSIEEDQLVIPQQECLVIVFYVISNSLDVTHLKWKTITKGDTTRSLSKFMTTFFCYANVKKPHTGDWTITRGIATGIVQSATMPVNDRKQLAQHLKQKHNYHSSIIHKLCSKVYPHW